MAHPEPAGRSVSGSGSHSTHQSNTPVVVPTSTSRTGGKRRTRKTIRPSTAPLLEKKTDMLPSVPAPKSPPAQGPNEGDHDVDTGGRQEDAYPSNTIDGSDSVEAHSPTSTSRDDDWQMLSTNLHTSGLSQRCASEYDWATFVNIYASGRWDPLRTPNPPVNYQSTPVSGGVGQTPHSAVDGTNSTPIFSERDSPLSRSPVQPQAQTPRTQSQSETESQYYSDRTSSIKAPPILSTTLSLPPSAHWSRPSFSESRTNSTEIPDPGQSGFATSAEVLATAAATMRVAGSRIDLSPLVLPSPEHELTDPMRDHTTTIPGSVLPEITRSRPTTPTSARRPRLTSFWHGTQDIDEGSNLAVGESGSRIRSWDRPTALELSVGQSERPVSVPTVEIIPGDYFGNLEPISEEASKETQLAFIRAASPLVEIGSLPVPSFPRTTSLTRQASSPLPATTSSDPPLPGSRIRSEGSKAATSAKEEQSFAELDYLAPPNPPDELDRSRALHKFNIWQTGPDLNFDRIAHLAKLVFKTKIVIISLIDGKEQWFKSEWGMNMASCERIHSFCGHSILQRGDEPMVILDPHQDWRFRKNPLVTGEPKIRFYAGAPLRTQDGFNIGSLAVMCDHSRQDFSPRQRHTLKEFAAIAMRELELWRDKIQLRVRDRIQDSMEQFSRECLEIDTAAQTQTRDHPDLFANTSMDRVYDRAAKLVKRTLDVEGVVIVDVSHCEVLETMSTESTVSVVMHYGDPQMGAGTRIISLEEYHNLTSFFAKHPDGKISEGIISPSLRPFLPTHIQYALTVPVFNIDKRPFALLCAYNALDYKKRFLEGHELSYLRAIGVIILSAVLKRRMIFADKAKSLFISNISHELRTPLHGILAAAELLADTRLDHNQTSFLQTVQACGTSLVETVNHVLDFTKLVGSAKSDVSESVIALGNVDLVQLVEEAVDGCWIGHHARTAELQDSEIGSYYSPPTEGGQPRSSSPTAKMQVEIVVDIGRPERGWVVKCEKGGIRRVLMNLFSNSLKFTKYGFIHVVLRQLPRSEDDPPKETKIELTIHDTGKGISPNFLKNQLFQPFSQENPLMTGTGLGLAIVNSIVQSKSVGGKVDVWSEEGVGTEVKVTFAAEISNELHTASPIPTTPRFRENKPPSVSLVGFDENRPGVQLLHTVLCLYLVSWWGFTIQPPESEHGDVVILNNDPSLVEVANRNRDTDRPFIVLSSSRHNPHFVSVAREHEAMGGFCRIVHKPGGPYRLGSVLKLCLQERKIIAPELHWSPALKHEGADAFFTEDNRIASPVLRRHSQSGSTTSSARPGIGRRSWTADLASPPLRLSPSTRSMSSSTASTISVGSGGTLLESSVGTVNAVDHQFRVLVVEDNSILRSLLAKWLKTKGYAYREAVDGRHGVTVFEQEGPFDIVLLDLSMPILDGVGATTEIRRIESVRAKTLPNPEKATRILALTGMSSMEDKQRAFEAGVDGYLVKPVAFKTLDEMFHKLISA